MIKINRHYCARRPLLEIALPFGLLAAGNTERSVEQRHADRRAMGLWL
jgi:hypothetical protein